MSEPIQVSVPAPKPARKFTPVQIDGLMWVLLALFTTQQQMLTGEEAYKYASPKLLFWLKFTIASFAASCAALKMFRSTSYARHVSDPTAPKEHPIITLTPPK